TTSVLIAGREPSLIKITRLFACRLSVPPEKAIRFPLWSLGIVGNRDHQPANDVFILRSSRKLYRLIQVVRRGMIALCQPIFENLFLVWSAGIEAHSHRQRWNSTASKVVLITTNEYVPKRLGSGLHVNAVRLRDSTGHIPKI